MKLASFEIGGTTSWGAVEGNAVVDLGARRKTSLLEELSLSTDLQRLESEARFDRSDYSVSDVRLLPPVVRGDKIVCIGVNYMNRNAEYQDSSAEPDWPSLFMRAYDSFTGAGQNLYRPPESHKLDYEGEIVLVIGKAGHRIPQSQALDHIAGLTLMNEGTLRDWVRHAKFNVTQGKNFFASGSIGPWMVTRDEFSRFDDLTLETHVNGELRQSDTTANLLFPVEYLISYLSIFYALRPGDMISIGTPQGAGARFDPPKYLAPGDSVTVTSPLIGQLTNGIEDDPTAPEDFTKQLRDNRTAG
jgi:5-carboxymethyl-2-hydroxymuconate isomerase